jgi:hypothetical protein
MNNEERHRTPEVRSSLFASCRIFTGKADCARAYIRDRQTGKVVWACNHLHRSRLRTGGKNSECYAMRCAEKALRRVLNGEPA